MKAVVCTQYGPPEVLQLKEMEKPVPRDNEVLIKVYATSVTSGDCRCRGFNIPAHFSLLTRVAMRLALGITRPRKPIQGLVLAGEVETTGRGVTRFKAGDQVFGDTGMRFGAYAEYTCLPENAAITIKPANITYEEAASCSLRGQYRFVFSPKREDPEGAERADLWSLRSGRDFGSTACPVLWGRGHRGMQFRKP